MSARLERQRLLHRKQPAALSFIIKQSLLERHTGGEAVTRELLDHLIVCAELTNVELQVMLLRALAPADSLSLRKRLRGTL